MRLGGDEELDRTLAGASDTHGSAPRTRPQVKRTPWAGQPGAVVVARGASATRLQGMTTVSARRSARRRRPAALVLPAWVRTFPAALDLANVTFGLALLLVVLSTLFGGASQTNALSLTTVELASVPLLMVAGYRLLTEGAPGGGRLALVLLGAVAALPLLQLIPLPYDLWTRLPGRAGVLQVLAVTRTGRPMLPLSLAPEQTWQALLALSPPSAMFMGALLLTDRQRRLMAGVWMGLGALSLAIGVLQVLGGPDSRWYFYAITNRGSPVGLFANRNHEAALLYSLLPFAGLFAGRFRGDFGDRRSLPPLISSLYLMLAIAGVGVTLSRTGAVLAAVGLLAAAAVAARGGIFRRRWRASAILAAACMAGVAAVLLLGFAPLAARFSEIDATELRFQGWPLVLGAARDHLPLGSGLGSFQTIYFSVEPLSQVSGVYFNHAHNDYLELWLEAGLAGAVLLGLFLAWLAVRTTGVWIQLAAAGADLAAAASLTLLLLLAHSAVDYPLRTEALAVLFAFACAALARGAATEPPVASTRPAPESDGSRAPSMARAGHPR